VPDTIFEVNTGKFSGPLELLLELIEKKKLFINDISLSEITDDYIKSINRQENIRKENISSFISVASTLLLIKSRSLLPHLELTDEEEESIEHLEVRLKQYKMMKDLSLFVKENFGLSTIFLPEKREMEFKTFSPHESISKENLLNAAHNLLSGLPDVGKEEYRKAKVRKIISLEEIINNLTERIKKAVKLSFSEFAKGHQAGDEKEHRVNTVVSFLAILELFKQGLVRLSQENQFSEIEIESVE
jgi:segregation and condensation protein A